MPSIMSFITWEPTSNVPTQPRSTQIQGFTSRRTRNSDTNGPLPGGRIADKRKTTSWPLFPLREWLISPSAFNRIGKNARNILKATAWDTMPHCGMTRARVRNSLFAIERSAIAPNYSVHAVFCRFAVPAIEADHTGLPSQSRPQNPPVLGTLGVRLPLPAPVWYAEISSAPNAVQKTRFLPRELLFLAAALFLIPIP